MGAVSVPCCALCRRDQRAARLQGRYARNFANPQTVILALILIIGSVLVVVMSQHLMPILISIVIAYLFEGTVKKLGYLGINRTISASLMTALFLTMILLLMVSLLGMNTFYILSSVQAGHEVVGVYPVSTMLSGFIKAGEHTILARR